MELLEQSIKDLETSNKKPQKQPSGPLSYFGAVFKEQPELPKKMRLAFVSLIGFCFTHNSLFIKDKKEFGWQVDRCC